MRSLLFKSSLIIFLAICSLYFPSNTKAHPIDEIGNIKLYDQSQTLELSPNKTKLTIYLTFYALEKSKIWESIDLNRDQKISDSEKDNWMSKGLDASSLEINQQINYFLPSSLKFPDYYNFFSSNTAKVEIEFISDLKAVPNSNVNYIYKGKDKTLDQITFKAVGTDGFLIKDVKRVDSSKISMNVSTGSASTNILTGFKSNERVNKFLDTFIKTDKLPVSLMILATFSAFAIGALHALTPGHGKALVAGYLVGEKGTFKNAIQLGLIITITHTSSVFILGLAALYLTRFIIPLEIIKWMNLTSGTLIVVFGIYLLIKRLKDVYINKQNHKHLHDQGIHHHHSHEHNHLRENIENVLTWKNLIPLGVSGGIIPCIDALAILIVAVSLQKIIFGLILLIVFSLGLASALISTGIIVVFTNNKAIKKFQNLEKYSQYISIASAFIVTILGIGILRSVLVHP